MENEEQSFGDSSSIQRASGELMRKNHLDEPSELTGVNEGFLDNSGVKSNKILLAGVFLMVVSIVAAVFTFFS